jgi:hypothetical protein
LSADDGSESSIRKIREGLWTAGMTDATLQHLEAAAILNAMADSNGDRLRAGGFRVVTHRHSVRKLGGCD